MARLDCFGNKLTLRDGSEVFSAYTRSDPDALQAEVAAVAGSAVVDGMMRSVGGMVAVLNRYRQVLAANDYFFRHLGIADAVQTVGLRLGEAVDCAHLDQAPKGCGTGRFCSSCGAAIAMVTSLCSGDAVERRCVAHFRRPQGELELCLNVRATPLMIGPNRVIVVLLQDITDEELQAETRQVFLHDVANVVAALAGGTNLLLTRVGREDAAARLVSRNMVRLQQELTIQRTLAAGEDAAVTQQCETVAVASIISEVADLLENHPAAHGKLLKTALPGRNILLHTSVSLLLRVLSNMLINALEATADGGEVVLSVEASEGAVSFSVWNSQTIPMEIRPRIFERFFSTKGGKGRGFGTYIIKRFGEHSLGGRVTFITSETGGTTFTLTLPQPHLSETQAA